jgi:hypothetical protein
VAVDHGGGIALYSSGASNITSATIAGNSAQSAGSGQNIVLNSASSSNVQNTIVSGPDGALNCKVESGGFNSLGHNISSIDGVLVSGGSCNFDQSSDRINTDPLLSLLGDYGGPTQTMGFLDHSPAKDGGTSVGATVDQRGYERPFDWVSIDNFGGGDDGDVGAFEFQPMFITPFRKDFGAVAAGTASPVKTFTLKNDYGSGLTIGAVQLVGPDEADFQLGADSCSGKTPFDDLQTCTFDITFIPQSQAMGPRAAQVELTNDVNHQSLPVPLSGFVAGDAPPSPPSPPAPPVQTPQGQTQGVTATATGQRAAALSKCKKKKRKSARARKKCRKKANALPV